MADLQHKPSFLQIDFVGDDNINRDHRYGIFAGVKPELITDLQKLLHQNNNYIKDFKAAVYSLSLGQKEFKVVISVNRKPAGEHAGRFNVPTSREVAIVIVCQEFEKRDIYYS